MALLFVVGLAAAPAGAAPGTRLRVVGQDATVKFNCQWTVSKVDSVHGTVTGKLTGNSFPASLFGYGQIVRNEIVCALTNGADTVFVGELDKTNNGASVSGSLTLVVPLYSSYLLCGAAGYTTKNGTSGATEAVCQAG
jgi:hypothetical protein